MAFVEIRTTLPDHKKAKAMARDVGMRRPWVVGHLVCLWTWALDNVPASGSLAGIAEADLEEAAQWPEERAGELLPAMVGAGFVDAEQGGYFIHDWDEYTGRLLRRREEDRDRKREARAAERATKTPATRKPSASRPADTSTSPADRPAQSDGKRPKSASPRAPARDTRASPRGRTAPHRTDTAPPKATESKEVPTARATSTRAGRAGASAFGIGTDDPRHPVAQLLKRRFRYRDVTTAQWDALGELVDNEYPIGTRRGADRHAAWAWLAELMDAIDRKAGDPIEAALAEVNRRIAERKAAADAVEVDWSEAKTGAPVLAPAISNGIAAAANGQASRVDREAAIAQLREVRGQVPEPAWSQMLERYHVSEEDLEDPVDFTPPEEAPAHG